MSDDLSFGLTKCYKSGSKAGRFYAEATIKPEHRALYNGRKQQPIRLGTDPYKVEALRSIEIAKANKKHRNKIAAHDPLIAAAERLIEALIVERDPVGKKLEVKDWYPRPLTTEELEGLRHHTIEESPAKTEYNRLLQALRNETFNLLYSEHNQITIPAGAISEEAEETNLQPYYDKESSSSVHWRPTGSFAAAKKELEAQGKTQKEIDEWFKLLYQTGFLHSTYDAWHRRDQINDA